MEKCVGLTYRNPTQLNVTPYNPIQLEQCSQTHDTTAKTCSRLEYLLALVADVLSQPHRLDFGVALVAEGAAGVPYEARVGQLHGAHLALEALGVPVGVHRLDDAADDELAALAATGREQHLEVVLAVLAALELVEDAVFERAEALGATENPIRHLV